ncbi:hypothetical protein J437_LFUL007709 [Ladona fulva]|uniref:Fork-head domain-containing protein n=1 Tax=Ladona fulva TaxID=123851 RepID=A0A8K0KAN1_LADFU|nr:hypothetical protein J437_LFUL007709 [Ladona fulva]
MDLYLSPQDGGLSLQEMLDCDIKTEIDSVLLGGSGGSSEFGLGDLPPLDLLESSLDGTGFGGLCGTGSNGTGLNGMMMLSPLEISNVGPATDMVSWLSSSSGTCGGGVSSVSGSGGMCLDLDAAGMMVSPSSVMPVTIVRQKPENKSVPTASENTEKQAVNVTLAATTTTSTIPTTTVSLTQVKTYTVTNSGMLPKNGSSHRIAVSNGVPLLRTTISTSRQSQSSPKHQYQQVTTTTPTNNHSNHVLHSSSRGGNSQQKRVINTGKVYTQHVPTSSSSSTDSLDDGGGGNNNSSSEKAQQRTYPKPAYSYSCLIAMALKNSTTGSLPVSEIYNFMCEHFPYFKTAPNGWKNSVRHNLSLNKCFEKIEKPSSSSSPSSTVSSSGVSGSQQRKGCLWAMNPAKIPKMDEEVQKWSRKDPNAIRKAMICPDNLELLERGDMKRDISSAGSVSCEDSEDEEAGSVGVSSPNPAAISTATSSATHTTATTTTYLVAGRKVGGMVVSGDRGYFRKVKHKVEEEEEEEADEEEEDVEVDEEEEVVEEDGVMDGVVVLEDDVKTENDMDYMDIKMELLDGTNIVDFDLDVAEGIYEELGDDRLNLGVNITSSSSLAASSPSHLTPSTITVSELKETVIGASPTVIPLSTPTIQGNYVYKASRRKAGGPLLLSNAGAIRKLNGL